MEGMSLETDAKQPVPILDMGKVALEMTKALANLLRDHKGEEAVALDLREMGSWTDFFVIATAASDTHMDGLERHIKEFCAEREIAILRRSRKPGMITRARKAAAAATVAADAGLDEWRIIDLGSTVVHLMSRRARKFYELERLYSMATAVPVLPETGC